jgi:hypothetical protein
MFDLIFKLALITAMAIILRKTLGLYLIKNLRNDKTRIFITLQIYVIIVITNGLASYILISFFDPPSIYALITIQTAWVLNTIVCTVYYIEFTYRAFSIHPSQKFIRFIYILIGFFIGLTLTSPFTNHDWIGTKMSPDIIMILTILLIFGALTTITVAADISQRKQSILLIKKSMQYYTYAYAIPSIFLFIFLIIIPFGINSFDNNLLVNLMSSMLVINIILCYIAFFQPTWFKRRYEKERSHIEKLFDKVRISK